MNGFRVEAGQTAPMFMAGEEVLSQAADDLR